MKRMRLACVILDRHRFETFSDGFKRRCAHCDREEWLMRRSYAGIGQPTLFWMAMGLDERARRARKHQAA